VSKRIALITTILLLLVQAAPVLACVAMPGQALSACCCEPNRDCPMGQRASECVEADACCVQAGGSTPALSGVTAHADEREISLPSATGAPPAVEPLALIEQASLVAAHSYHHSTTPPPAVPLYLRHLRLTL